QVFDNMAEPYDFKVIDASQSADRVFVSLQKAVSKVVGMELSTKRPTGRKAVPAVKTLPALRVVGAK
ncbi:MAG: hypothetical protein ABI833_23185, partial [Acidobacteriota bacterium]